MPRKSIFKSILAVLICLAMTLGIVMTFTSCDNKDGGKLAENAVENFPELKTGETIYILPNTASVKNSIVTTKASRIQTMELILAVSIQGLVARDKAQIYIGAEDDDWVEYLKEDYGLNFEVLDSIKDLFTEFADKFEKKTYVKYRFDETAVMASRLNQATTIASATGSILIPDNEILEELAISHGFELLEGADLTVDASGENTVIEKYKDDLSKDVIAAVDPRMKESFAIRDYLIANKSGVLLSDVKEVMGEIYKIYNPLSIAIGVSQYSGSGYGTKGIDIKTWSQESATQAVVPVVVSSCPNLSLFSSLSKDVGTQKDRTKSELSDDVHYVAVLANLGYDLGYWADAPFSNKKLADENRGKYPIGYTMTPSLLELMPQAMKKTYSTMSDRELFVAAPNGLGYADLAGLEVHDKGLILTKYLEKTNDIIGKSDLGYVSYFGSLENTKYIDMLAGLSNVKGGFVLTENAVTPKGGVYFSNEKTFVAAREVLRDSTGNTYRTNEQVANDNAAKMAARLSTYSKDKTSAEAYTLIQVQDTATENTYTKLYKELFEKAGEDICFVTPDQLLELINENVSKEGSLTQTIGSLNIAPKAENIEVSTDSGKKVVVDVSEKISDENPEDNTALTVQVGLRPENGKCTISGTKITYTPTSGFAGTDSFEYIVYDGNEMVKAKVTITVG